MYFSNFAPWKMYNNLLSNEMWDEKLCRIHKLISNSQGELFTSHIIKRHIETPLLCSREALLFLQNIDVHFCSNSFFKRVRWILILTA